ncbi:trypsin-like peptidase domain-containing protein [Lentzea nigeriaca]|uniref:trypsin-like peptidase domain-containing protein n=1 Tax=Lentzea nigeriaca TaxID=1128665 RepID=UPI001957E6FB|nr:trypsin-like peptidase domain-containing protein [Lentzea nigeriaca]MBM7861584.1 V8-like Glu-specific endopeptidase [Lentzea nigeriaca]
MAELALAHRQQLVSMLRSMPVLATEQSRRDMLELSGLSDVAPNIDVSGSPFEAVNTIVNHLLAYGRLPGGPHALGLFLNLLKGFAGQEGQVFLADLLDRYDLMTPIALSPDIASWRGSIADVAEKIIRSNTLRPIAFLSAAVAVSRSVAYLELNTAKLSWSGSGFLVGPDLLLTNNHVLPDAECAARTTYRFNYQDDVDGRPEIHHDFQARPDGIFHTSESLDYALVQLDGRPGDNWGYLPLRACQVAVGDRVNVIQHPGGQPKQIAMRDNLVEYIGGGVVQYVTSTLPGSSGAPVLTDDWTVCAVHHAGGMIIEPTTQRRFFRNEGILISEILHDLPDHVRAALPDTDVRLEQNPG